MAEPANRVLVVFDFDNTVVDENSDTYIVQQLDTSLWEEMKQLYHQGTQWTDLMAAMMEKLYDAGYREEDMDRVFASISLPSAMQELLLALSEKQHVDIDIVSDANTFFIQSILKHFELQNCIRSIITNPGAFNSSGKLEIARYCLSPHSCSRCASAPNMCKGEILDKIGFAQYSKVLYIGDGSNDLCPATRLDASSAVFPRVGFSLDKKLKQGESASVCARILPWETYEQLRDQVLAEL